MDKAQAAEFLSRHGWLAATPAPFRDNVIARSDLIVRAAGQPLYRAGDPASGLFGVAAGRLELHHPVFGDEPTLGFIGGPGFWAGDTAAVSGDARRITIVAGGDTVLMRLPRAELVRLGAADPAAWRHVADLLAHNYGLALDILAATRRARPEARVAAILAILVREGAGDGALTATQADLAALSRQSRTTVNTALRDLEARGLVHRGYGSVTVVDRAALDALLTVGK